MFLDIESSYEFVTNRLNELVSKFGFNKSMKIMIYDFYPIIHELVSVVPVSPIQPQYSLMEFRYSKNAFLTAPDAIVSPLSVMPLDKYISELELYKNTLQQMYPQYSVESKPNSVMYENYKNTVINKFISGMVGLDVSGLIDERPLFKYIPPEGSQAPLSEEMYYIAIKRVFPDLALSEMALNGMYNLYLEHFGLNDKLNQIPGMDPAIINISLSFPDEASMTAFITNNTPANLSIIDIETILNSYPNVSVDLQTKILPYLNTMNSYGIRESIAVRMLLYHVSFFNLMKNELMDRAGFVVNPAYSVLFMVGEYQPNYYASPNDNKLNNIDYQAMRGIL